MKVQRMTVTGKDGTADGEMCLFYCPACKEMHSFNINRPGRPVWTYNGDPERPTFSPSLLIYTTRPRKGLPDDPDYDMRPEDWQRVTRCHLFVRNGRIEYCGDCPHPLAGKTVDLPDIPDDMRW